MGSAPVTVTFAWIILIIPAARAAAAPLLSPSLATIGEFKTHFATANLPGGKPMQGLCALSAF